MRSKSAKRRYSGCARYALPSWATTSRLTPDWSLQTGVHGGDLAVPVWPVFEASELPDKPDHVPQASRTDLGRPRRTRHARAGGQPPPGRCCLAGAGRPRQRSALYHGGRPRPDRSDKIVKPVQQCSFKRVLCIAGASEARWDLQPGAPATQGGTQGLDHFEGRSWTGLHRHRRALMTMMAYAFLQTPRLTQAGRKKCLGTSASAGHARHTTVHRGTNIATFVVQIPTLRLKSVNQNPRLLPK